MKKKICGPSFIGIINDQSINPTNILTQLFQCRIEHSLRGQKEREREKKAKKMRFAIGRAVN